jgi:hypothetical protein
MAVFLVWVNLDGAASMEASPKTTILEDAMAFENCESVAAALGNKNHPSFYPNFRDLEAIRVKQWHEYGFQERNNEKWIYPPVISPNIWRPFEWDFVSDREIDGRCKIGCPSPKSGPVT